MAAQGASLIKIGGSEQIAAGLIRLHRQEGDTNSRFVNGFLSRAGSGRKGSGPLRRHEDAPRRCSRYPQAACAAALAQKSMTAMTAGSSSACCKRSRREAGKRFEGADGRDALREGGAPVQRMSLLRESVTAQVHRRR
jgi:hypothetical protein